MAEMQQIEQQQSHNEKEHPKNKAELAEEEDNVADFLEVHLLISSLTHVFVKTALVVSKIWKMHLPTKGTLR